MARNLSIKGEEAPHRSRARHVRDASGPRDSARSVAAASVERVPLRWRIGDPLLDVLVRHRLLFDISMLGAGVAVAPLVGAANISVRPLVAGRGTTAGIAWGSVFIVSSLIAMK